MYFLQINNVDISFLILVPGCDNIMLVGNGFCNDETNNADCNYDGGDCCVVNVNTDTCSKCGCLLLETCAAGYHPFVGNGFCNDNTNIAECDYDGGDCCGYNINLEHCTECSCKIKSMFKNFIVEKFRKQLYFFTCSLPDHVFHES